MKPRADIDWFDFAADFLFWRLGCKVRGETAGSRTLALRAFVPRATMRRLIDQGLDYRGCKDAHFRRICALMQRSPRRYIKPGIKPRPYRDYLDRLRAHVRDGDDEAERAQAMLDYLGEPLDVEQAA